MPLRRVLVVDDDPLVLVTVMMQVERAGFLVAGAGDGAEALQRCAQVRPDVAVVDLRLPDVSGIELIRRLRENIGIPCVLLTGMDDPSIIAEAREAGATAFLRKPADTARLCAVLASVLEPAPPA